MTADSTSCSEGDEGESRYLMEVIAYVGAVQADTPQTGSTDIADAVGNQKSRSVNRRSHTWCPS